jgi:hypothetical protein
MTRADIAREAMWRATLAQLFRSIAAADISLPGSPAISQSLPSPSEAGHRSVDFC